MPRSAASPAKSGGAQRSTSAPRAASACPSARKGWMSPRVPSAASTMRIPGWIEPPAGALERRRRRVDETPSRRVDETPSRRVDETSSPRRSPAVYPFLATCTDRDGLDVVERVEAESLKHARELLELRGFTNIVFETDAEL